MTYPVTTSQVSEWKVQEGVLEKVLEKVLEQVLEQVQVVVLEKIVE